MPPNTRIAAGDLRHRIKIMDLTNAQSSTGGTSPKNVTLFRECWASVTTLVGADKYAAAQRISEVTHKITIRYADGISSSQVIFFQDKYFEIVDPRDPDGQKIMLEIDCIQRGDSNRFEGGGAS